MLKEYNYHTKIMGCDFDMTFVTTSVEKADAYFNQSFSLAKSYEECFSRFDSASELSLLNNTGQLSVSDKFLSVYGVAKGLHAKTNGLFNPLLQVSSLGYNKSFEKLLLTTPVKKSFNYNINFNEILLENNKITLGKNKSLDFGGFLKGYVVEKIALSISCPNLIINIGGDLYAKGVDENNELWKIEIENPKDKKCIIIPVKNMALCTSGIYKRKWLVEGFKKHHIIDTQTKDTALTNVLSVSVLSYHGDLSDALATVAVSVGSARAKLLLKDFAVNFVIITEDGNIMMSDDLSND